MQIIITAVGPKDSTYEQFLAALPEGEPRFAGASSIPASTVSHCPLAARSAPRPDMCSYLFLYHVVALALNKPVSPQCTTIR